MMAPKLSSLMFCVSWVFHVFFFNIVYFFSSS